MNIVIRILSIPISIKISIFHLSLHDFYKKWQEKIVVNVLCKMSRILEKIANILNYIHEKLACIFYSNFIKTNVDLLQENCFIPIIH